MALIPIRESLEGLAAEVAKEYTEQSDGTFKLDVTPTNGWMLDNTTKLKRTISTLRKEKGELEQRTAGLTDEDGNELDIAEARAALVKLASLGDGDQDAESRVQEAVAAATAQLKKKYEGELGSRDQRNSQLSDTVRRFRVDGAILQALTDTTGDRTSAKTPKVLMPAIRDMLRAVEKDGDFQVGVVDPDAPDQLRISPSQDSDRPMSVSELVDELRGTDEWGPQFNPKQVAGTQDRGDRNARPAPRPAGDSGGPVRLSATERLKQAHRDASQAR